MIHQRLQRDESMVKRAPKVLADDEGVTEVTFLHPSPLNFVHIAIELRLVQ